MGLTVRYEPPKRDARLLLAAAKPAATHAGAEVLLAASQPLVPVDTGELLASGRVVDDGESAKVVYDAVAPDGYPYGIRQHEDLTLNHPNGGQAKFLEAPMHSHGAEVLAAEAAILRAALR